VADGETTPPSFVDWAETLATNLDSLDTVFLTLSDKAAGKLLFTEEEEARMGIDADVTPDLPHQYARVLSRLIEALGALPPFADGRGLATLQALRMDIVSLDEGSKPTRLQPRPGISTGADNQGRRIAKAHVVLCIRLLEEIGESGASARKRVAAIFAAHGHTGKQGGPLSPGTLIKWREDVCGANEGDADVAGRRMIEAELFRWRASPLWPPALDDALALVARRAANPVISLAMTT
jgi:hypothetical protein